jgi:hypothetical protein
MVTIWIKALIVAGSLFVGLTSVYLLKMKPDNPIEEVCEKIVKDETGLDLDLTPTSSENQTAGTMKQ